MNEIESERDEELALLMVKGDQDIDFFIVNYSLLSHLMCEGKM